MQMLKAFVIDKQDEKQTATFFRMCRNEALYAMHVFHLTPTQLVWDSAV